MRPIDADALVNVVETARKKARTLTGMDFVMVTKDQPTIDVIPVEWLKNRREGLIFAAMTSSTVYGDNSIELCHAVNVVLDMWQKEHE